MTQLLDTQVLLSGDQLGVMLLRPSGEIIYENRQARELFGHGEAEPRSLLPSLTMPTSWDDVLARLAKEGYVQDEPVLVRTPFGEAEVCYLTAFMQTDAAQRPETIVCAWATRGTAIRFPARTSDTGTLAEYVHSLEGLIEQRAYQHLLFIERNEQAREALDVLPVGVLVVSRDGALLYHNRAARDHFGLRPTDYPEPNVRHFLAPDLRGAFQRVVETGLRSHCAGRDPGGSAADVDILPIWKSDQVQRVVVQFSRAGGSSPCA